LYGSRREGGRRRRDRGGAARDATGERLGDWTDLRPGEYVVHAQHGIGKYLGMYEIRFEGALQEALAVEYEGGARLYVPTGQVHLLSRYVGIGHARPALHALGGKRWQKEKEAAERAAHDLAAQMLETQARRQAMGGFAFPPDGEWQAAFEATFPHAETPDQLAAVEEVKRDMESAKPMDRLLCGDAGYGKTEVAMRAAFKAVEGGKQVAVLVPTTVLAQQHYETFAGRMGRWPVTVEVVSRFRSAAAQRETLARAALGKVDVLIGTHRLLQKDVKFADLGLVIIDEEQRFGVAAKERLKRMKQGVDVLTLSATPIPRTLYLSLTGARDLSLIQTPPRERLPIETFVAQDTDELVREAVLNELNRGGQVFFLHNRVQSIGAVRRRLERLVPGVRVGVGHGQMGEKALAGVMRAFIRRETDVLLCTTIVESGVDIPNVNTILIDRSDRFGMADLYQLRGRVGRSRQQAYAYLLLPRHGLLFGAARERIGALRKHAGLGAGYKLALRDLEIRGAGNVLGAEQSGHIAAVGFDLYCQLLNRTVARLKGEAPRPVIETRTDFDFLRMSPDPAEAERAAVIPADFIEDENVRIGLYRSLAGVALAGEAESLEEEWRDRFGELPGPMKRLLALARIRVLGAGLGVKEMRTEGDRLMLSRGGGRWIMPGGRHIRLHKHGADERLGEIEKRLGQLARGAGGGGER
jgi:transcription-repair coupling factor (superfamily II helicase)